MANERAWMYRNTGTEEAPIWAKWFAKTVADAVMMSDKEGEELNIKQYVDKRFTDLIGVSTPETLDTFDEIAKWVDEHEDVSDALNNAILKKADKDDLLYKNQTPSTVDVGGVGKGYVPPTSGIEAVALLDKILHAYVAPKVAAAAVPDNGGTFEIGASKTVTSVTATITMGSAAIKKIEVLDGSTVIGSLASGIKGGANTVPLTTPLTVTANRTLSVKVTDAEDKTVSANTGAFTFVSPFYYGAIAAGAAINETTIKAAAKSVTTKGNKTFNFTCSNQKMLFAYPKAYGKLTKILDANNFDVTSTFASVEVTVDGVVYYAYSNDASTVSAFKMTFNF